MSEEGLDLTRREFMQIGTVGMASLSGTSLQASPPENPDNPQENYAFQGVAHLLGPESAKPDPGSSFFDNKQYYSYLYEVNDPPSERGTTYYITQADNEWTLLDKAMPETQVEEVRVEDYKSFFNHTFARPNAPDAKNWDFTSADITKLNSEVELASTTVLETTQRGNYPPGTEAIPGAAFRVTGTPTGGSAYAGYFDAQDGFGAGEDSTDSYVFIRKGGNEEKVYRTDWNGYVPSSRVWQSDSPVVTRFPHLFYGGGSIRIRALLHENGTTRLRTLHTFTPNNIQTGTDGPPFNQPNLPMRFESSGLTGGNLRANAAHYDFGESDAENRVNGEHFTEVSVGTTGWTPLISWRKRSGWEMTNVKPLRIKAFASSANVKLELQLGSTLSTPSWSLPTNTSSSETAVEVDTSGSLSSNGERRWVGFAASGQGAAGQGQSEATILDFNLPATQNVTLAAQAVGGTATVSGFAGWEEYF